MSIADHYVVYVALFTLDGLKMIGWFNWSPYGGPGQLLYVIGQFV